MMYMDDAIKATIDLMEADGNRLTVRYGYNLAAMSFSPEEIFQEIKNTSLNLRLITNLTSEKI